MSEKYSYLEHHVRLLNFYANEPGTPEELADKLMDDLKTSPMYPQTPEMRLAIVQAIEHTRAGKITMIEDTQQNLTFDRICAVCRHCFDPKNSILK